MWMSFLLWQPSAASNDPEVCPHLTQASCPSVLSDDGAVFQYIPKPVKPDAYTLPQLPPEVKIPGNLKRYVCTRPACLSDPCLHQSQCTETDDGFNCTCLDGWQGKRCGKATFIKTVRILGGNSCEGRIVFAPRYSPENFRLIHQNGWTANASRLVCQYLGFQGAYGTLNGNLYGESSQDVYAKVGVVSCPTNAANITDCWVDEETDDDMDTTIGIACCSGSPSMSPGSPLGLENGVIPGSVISASSCLVYHLCTPQARLNGPASWCSSGVGTDQWLQVQFESNYLVSGIITQGRRDVEQYVTSYKMSSSVNNIIWTEYVDPFTGSVKDEGTPYSLTWRNVRHAQPYSPKTNRCNLCLWEKYHITTAKKPAILNSRTELISASAINHESELCPLDRGVNLGVEDGRIPDTSMSSSSTYSSGTLAQHGRLNIEPDSEGTSAAWTPLDNDKDGWLKIDLGEEFMVTGVITQGRSNDYQWVTSMSISTSLDDIFWVFTIDPVSLGRKVYPANYDRNTQVTSSLPEPVRARYIRIHPVTFKKRASMRVEILGHGI
ncbi:lactadherin-like [Diadema antillarum]|uniref:lactadherin-like n=1 Tax=Diadema antillarum TaxID=105358 RepID=UPI003A8563A1